MTVNGKKPRNTAGLKRGGGRPKGTPNKLTKQLKDMILAALDNAGGEAYLTRCAKQQPKAFLALLGRVLPTEVKHDAAGGSFSLTIHRGPQA